jgi:hypothetical protein
MIRVSAAEPASHPPQMIALLKFGGVAVAMTLDGAGK